MIGDTILGRSVMSISTGILKQFYIAGLPLQQAIFDLTIISESVKWL